VQSAETYALQLAFGLLNPRHMKLQSHLFLSASLLLAACGGGPTSEVEVIDASKIAALSPGQNYETRLDHAIELVSEPALDLSRINLHILNDVITARALLERTGVDVAHLPTRFEISERTAQPAAEQGPYGSKASGLRASFDGSGTCISNGSGVGLTDTWIICCYSKCTYCTNIDTSDPNCNDI
jgi:hypothetical protein